METKTNPAEFLVIGEGRKARFYLTGFGKDGSPRFKANGAGRANAQRFETRAEAETEAGRAQMHDRHGITWAARIA